MKKELEQAFAEQAGRLFSLCETYIDGTYSQEEREPLFGLITKLYNGLEVDFGKMFEEVMANLEEPMSEQQRERYCFSLLTPFEAYSNTLYPKVLISKSQESIGELQGLDGADKLKSIFENQIKDANERSYKYLYLGFDADALETDDEAIIIFFDLAQIVAGYGNMLDAAFVMHGLDLKRLQERCGVWLKQYKGGEAESNIRASQIKEFVGNLTLAEEYISRLEQDEEIEISNKEEPQHGEQQEQEEPQQTVDGQKEKPKRGRPTEPFASKMINDADGGKLKKMHTILKGKKGKDFALIIWACIKKGWCNKPTYKQVTKEFGDIGSSTGYNRYLNNNIMFTKEEKDGALKALD